MPRFRSAALSVAAAVAVTVVACSESNSTAPLQPLQPLQLKVADASAVSSITSEGRKSRFKFHETRGTEADDETADGARSAASPSTNRATVNSGITFHGGPVLQATTNVVAVYWASAPIYVKGPKTGTGLGTADSSIVGFFLRNLGGSPWFNINATYTNAAGLKINNLVKYTGYWANATSAPASGATVTDAAILAMLQSGFTAGTLTYDSNTIYSVFTGPKVNLGGGAGTSYCAYHSAATMTIAGVSRTVLYTAQPYAASWSSACTATTVSANGDLGADVEVNLLAHEIAETTTDPPRHRLVRRQRPRERRQVRVEIREHLKQLAQQEHEVQRGLGRQVLLAADQLAELLQRRLRHQVLNRARLRVLQRSLQRRVQRLE